MTNVIDRLRAGLKNRARYLGWYTAKGKLTKAGRDGVIDALAGAGMALDAVGLKKEAQAITLQVFLCSTGRVDEFMNTVRVPTLEELEGLSFPTTQIDDQHGCEFADGSSGVVCTNFAEQVKKLYPDVTKIKGFNTKDNPVDHHEISACEGHDFAVVADRYIVDYWLRDVVGDVGRCVFDMKDPAHADDIHHRYGDPAKWS